MGKQISKRRIRWTQNHQPPKREVSDQLLKSFGATNHVFSMLPPGEVIRLQQLNLWSYTIGVARCQVSWRAPKVYCFTHYYSNMLFKFDLRKGSA